MQNLKVVPDVYQYMTQGSLALLNNRNPNEIDNSASQGPNKLGMMHSDLVRIRACSVIKHTPTIFQLNGLGIKLYYC